MDDEGATRAELREDVRDRRDELGGEDADDLCPNDPEDKDGFEDDDGAS